MQCIGIVCQIQHVGIVCEYIGIVCQIQHTGTVRYNTQELSVRYNTQELSVSQIQHTGIVCQIQQIGDVCRIQQWKPSTVPWGAHIWCSKLLNISTAKVLTEPPNNASYWEYLTPFLFLGQLRSSLGSPLIPGAITTHFFYFQMDDPDFSLRVWPLSISDIPCTATLQNAVCLLAVISPNPEGHLKLYEKVLLTRASFSARCTHCHMSQCSDTHHVGWCHTPPLEI